MNERKLVDEPDAVLRHKSQFITETKTIVVEIEDFSRKERITTPVIRLGDAKYILVVKNDGNNFCRLSLLSFLSASKEINANTTCSVKGLFSNKQMFEKNKKTMVHARMYLHQSICFQINDFKKWAEKNEDILRIEINLTHKNLRDSSWITRSKPRLEFDPLREVSVMFGNNNVDDLTDFSILSQEGTKYPCHRVILASQSEPLKAMMIHDTKEREESRVTLPFKEEVVKHLVQYFYTRTVPQGVLGGNLESFLSLAEEYDLQPLKLLAEKLAIREMSTKNMVDMFYLGDLYRAHKLKEASEFLIFRNREILKSQDLSKFPANIIAEVLKLLC